MPVLKAIGELTTESQKEFFEKTIKEAKTAVGGFYAVRASSDKELNGERIAAMLYLSDLAKGTTYEGAAEEIRLRFGQCMETNPGALPNLGAALKLHVPEQTVFTQPEESVNSIEKVSESVLSIETDQGVSGAGFFVGPKCNVLTNEHVISRAKTITLRTTKRNLFVGQVLAQDAARDLALLTTNADGCTALQLATGTAHVGTAVYAVGNPLGLEGTVTKGIVSANRVDASGVRLVQIDASPNPGNSGGPLVDQLGRELGVNTFRVKDTVGLNFSVSSDEVRAVFGRFLGEH